MSDSRRGFGLNSGFTEHLHAVTTNNCSISAHFHILPVTQARAMSFQSAFISRFLSTDFNTVTIPVSLHYTFKYHTYSRLFTG
jgi:hypothetical protein